MAPHSFVAVVRQRDNEEEEEAVEAADRTIAKEYGQRRNIRSWQCMDRDDPQLSEALIDCRAEKKIEECIDPPPPAEAKWSAQFSSSSVISMSANGSESGKAA